MAFIPRSPPRTRSRGAIVSATPSAAATATITADSDYGSDIELDDDTLTGLLTPSPGFPSPSKIDGPRISNLHREDTSPPIEPPIIIDDHGGEDEPLARLAIVRDDLARALAGLEEARTALASKLAGQAEREARNGHRVEIEYDEGNRRDFGAARVPADSNEPPSSQQPLGDSNTTEFPEASPENDPRSPLQRFRTRPQKPLSVTDLVSPAWCEQQYLYSLSKYGRVRRTPAMKQGSSVHKVLEEQVHTEVPVTTETKEDRFALRIWNVIQGLRTLRRTGMTRELEVWGVVQGEVVNGVVDQITVVCPDERVEREMLGLEGEGKGGKGGAGGKKSQPLPPDQRTLTEYLTPSQPGSVLEQQSQGQADASTSLWPSIPHDDRPRTYYIIDVKTRQSKSLPPQGSQLRPTQMQLMMYHRLFTSLAAGAVDGQTIFERYSVDSSAPFSDAFVAQMCGLNIGSIVSAHQEEDTIDEIFAHNTLTPLWSLMMAEYAQVLSPTSGTTVSPLLTAEFRTPPEGRVLGKRHFAFDATFLDAYISDELSWWKGGRDTRGVEVEEAFKCRFCEFAEACTWRATKIEEGVRKARLRKEARQKSSI